MAPSPFKMDEGYSEYPRTPSGTGSEVMMLDDEVDHETQHSAARQWLISQPADFRARTLASHWPISDDGEC